MGVIAWFRRGRVVRLDPVALKAQADAADAQIESLNAHMLEAGEATAKFGISLGTEATAESMFDVYRLNVAYRDFVNAVTTRYVPSPDGMVEMSQREYDRLSAEVRDLAKKVSSSRHNSR